MARTADCSLCHGSGWIPGVSYADEPLDEFPCTECYPIQPHYACQARGCEACEYTGCADAVRTATCEQRP